MSKHGNGSAQPEDSQTALDLEQESATAPDREGAKQELVAAPDGDAAESAEQESATAPDGEAAEDAEQVPNPVTELGNTNDGCWKVLADGERANISDQEWRKELTRLLASPATPPS